MDEPVDPIKRQMALSALTTEHFNLQTARVATISEASGRSTLYLGTLSSAVIAIAFIGQASELGDAFYLFALTLLPSVFVLGVFTYLRLVQTTIEDIVYALGSFRIREFFVRIDPAVAPYFPPTDPEGLRRLERIGFLPKGKLQIFLTGATMVGCINGIVGGVAVALALRAMLDASVPVATAIGALTALVFASLFLAFQVRRLQRAGAMAPELFDWEDSGASVYAERIEKRRS
jgi:hypothetical protein